MLYSFDHSQLNKDATMENLMARVKSRDEKALAELYRRHMPLLRSIIGKIINNEGDVEDIIQETLLELWNRAENYSEEKGQALGWIITIARRRAIDKLRRKQAYFRAGERARLEPAAKAHHRAYEDVNARELKGIFHSFLSQLPVNQREAVHFSYYCGMSHREIAANTGIPLGTVKTRLELAMRKIRTAVLAMNDFKGWNQQCMFDRFLNIPHVVEL